MMLADLSRFMADLDEKRVLRLVEEGLSDIGNVPLMIDGLLQRWVGR